MTEQRTTSNSSGRRRPEPRYLLEPELLELRQAARALRQAGTAQPGVRSHRQPESFRRPAMRGANGSRGSREARGPSKSRGSVVSRSRRRRRLLLPAAAALIALVLIVRGGSATTGSYASPSGASLAGLNIGRRIVAIANSQIGYGSDPSSSYCNKFSAYWGVGGAHGCPTGESSEQWCADFAAWAWRKAGVPFGYGFDEGEINASAASFYTWGVYHGTWHAASSGYRARPGDVAVYGLKLGATDTAAHVAVVTADPAGQRGPDVVNGDGDRTGFSVVETGTDQLRADTGKGAGALLAGYVSPD